MVRDIRLNDTVAAVIRHMHEDRLCGRLDDTYLVCEGKKLDADARIGDLNLQQHDYIEVRHRLRGGAKGNPQDDSSAGETQFPALPEAQRPVGQASAASILQHQGNAGNA